MGEVYLAHDDTLDRSVAIKFLIGNSDERARKRLLTEARAVAALDHPHICSIHEIDADEWLGDFIVMQYVEGETLSVRLQRDRMPPGEALGVCGRIADALRAAHTRGIIHRDLKPQNVILTASGDPKLLDFGLAKNISSSAKAAAAPTETQLTKPHAVLGTAGYMSPEQVRGHSADHRSDLFALGCVLYECLTGKRAFTGGTSADIHAEVLHREPPPPSTLVPELAPSHDALVARLLQKDPAQRFQSAEEALGAIRALDSSRWSKTDGGSQVDPAPPAPRPRARTIAIVSAIAAAVVALVLWQGPWFRRLPEAPADAAGWYNRGVDAIREGRFLAARTALDAAIQIFPEYALAHLRLAEAQSELDNAAGANAALVRADDAIPFGTRRTREQELRTKAIRSSVLRKHDEAIAAYRDLVRMHERDASAWLDLGRAQEAAGRRAEALESYQKALSLDQQYAAAHLRVGTVLVQTGNPEAGIREFDVAIRLYRTASQREGEIEALLRKGARLVTSGENDQARQVIQQALRLIEDSEIFYRARARFDDARLTAFEGNYSKAEEISRKTVDEAIAAGLYSVASSGLTDFSYTLTSQGRHDQADAELSRAIDLAQKHDAKRAEMRARLQRASFMVGVSRPEEIVKAVEEPLRFYATYHFPRTEADGKLVLAGAHEELENYPEALRLAREVQVYGQGIKDPALIAAALDKVAGVLTAKGQFTEALLLRKEREDINRDKKNVAGLSYDLNNRAELLIQLGRGPEAEVALREVADRAAEGVDAFKRRLRRTAVLQAMLASIQRKWAHVAPFAAQAVALPKPDDPPDESFLWGSILAEHARAQQGRSRAPIDTISNWLEQTKDLSTRRDMTYWVVQTLLARSEHQAAFTMAVAARDTPAVADNLEHRWRMAALAAIAGKSLSGQGIDSAALRADALRATEALKTAWSTQAAAYFERPDLALLLRQMQ
jgi:tetratricopeptide (TPR) repeat protein